ncbi:MAG: hypothetical protein ABI634_14730 [Acidobacteriota bacterium]
MTESVRAETIADLENLIAAIDRRLPRLANLSEPAIARESAELRDKARALIQLLEAEAASRAEAQT